MPTLKRKNPRPKPDALIPLAELGEIVGASYHTLYGWSYRGVFSLDGEKHALKRDRVNGRVVSCLRWVEEFKASLKRGDERAIQRRLQKVDRRGRPSIAKSVRV